MSEKIIYLNNLNNIKNLPNIEKKEWILKREYSSFIQNLLPKDIIWIIFIKDCKKEIYYGKIDTISINKEKKLIIFDNINKIDNNENFSINMEKNNRLSI